MYLESSSKLYFYIYICPDHIILLNCISIKEKKNRENKKRDQIRTESRMTSGANQVEPTCIIVKLSPDSSLQSGCVAPPVLPTKNHEPSGVLRRSSTNNPSAQPYKFYHRQYHMAPPRGRETSDHSYITRDPQNSGCML